MRSVISLIAGMANDKEDVKNLLEIFNKLDIDTHSVLEAAGTKWNFLPFKPGLVGGHCIGVDPYYLKEKSIKFVLNQFLRKKRLNLSLSQIAKNLLQTMEVV